MRSFETVRVVVYDPVAANRNATRTSLHSLGFRSLEFAATLELLDRAVRSKPVDLIFCDVSESERDVCRYIQSVRQSVSVPNPFVVVIATTWRCQGDIINQVLTSGADDLLARPFSTSMLADRIQTQIERRKLFVTTWDYTGPDRRRGQNRSGGECVKVANSLKMRSAPDLAGEDPELEIVEAIRQGREWVNAQRIRSGAYQLCVQWRLLEQRPPDSTDFLNILTELEVIVDELDRRTSASGHAFAAEWCQSVRESAQQIRGTMEREDTGGGPFEADLGPSMHLLGHATMTLGQLFAPEDGEPSQLVELDDAAARVKRRSERPSLRRSRGGMDSGAR